MWGIAELDWLYYYMRMTNTKENEICICGDTNGVSPQVCPAHRYSFKDAPLIDRPVSLCTCATHPVSVCIEHKPKKEKKETILDEASRITSTDRRAEYGSPTKNFNDIATMWSVVTGFEIRPDQVVMMMICLKICRQNAGYKRDSLVDIAGYARTGEMLHDGE
jgi:hypothetical protein